MGFMKGKFSIEIKNLESTIIFYGNNRSRVNHNHNHTNQSNSSFERITSVHIKCANVSIIPNHKLWPESLDDKIKLSTGNNKLLTYYALLCSFNVSHKVEIICVLLPLRVILLFFV